MINERESRCTEYINSHLGEPLKEGSLEFRTWKNCADIRDIDLYHQVAQALHQKELKKGFGGLFYLIRVPKQEGDGFGDIWNVTLAGERNQEFLEKYGEHYQVTDIFSKTNKGL